MQYLYHRLVTELGPPEWQANASAASGDGSLPAAGIDEESSAIGSLMSFLSSDPDLIKLRSRQQAYFDVFDPRRCASVEGMLANGADEGHHFVQRPILDQITSEQQPAAS